MLRLLFRRLARSRRGSLTPVAAITIGLVIMPLVGVTLDLTRLEAARNTLQDGLDAAGLAAGRMPTSTSNETLQSVAQTWLLANLRDTNLSPPVLTVTSDQGTIELDATAQLSTMMSGMIGFATMSARAHTEVKRGPRHMEIALVLDNTGSMAQNNKIGTLISSANALVDTLSQEVAQADPGSLKIGVVPFSMTVNVGPQYRTEPWMSGMQPAAYGSDLFSPPVDRFTLFDQMGLSWAGCVEARPQPYDVQETAPTLGTSGTMFTPYFAPDEPDDNSIVSGTTWWGGATYYTFPNNYVADGTTSSNWSVRQANPLKYVGLPRAGTSSATGYAYGPNAGCSLTPLLRLTTDFAAVHAKINQMQAVGDTNIPFGLMWGWHLLSPNGPFADGGAYDPDALKKIVVVLTDGQNTMASAGNPEASYYSGLGYVWQGRLGITSGSSSQRTTAMDGRMTTLCDNMKARGVILYTVRIDVSTSVSPAALRSCASGANRFYDVPDVADLPAAFAEIAHEIGNLRLSQ